MTKLVFETAVLSAALREVRGAVQRRNTIPILSNVLITPAADGTVQLRTTDMDIVVTRTIAAISVDQPAAFTIDAHRLADVVGAFAAGSQTAIALTDGGATVSSGRARTRFSILPASDFPVAEQRSVDCTFTIDAKTLNRGIDVVRHAICTEETRYYLNGIFVHATGDRLAFVATDGHRLARHVVDLPAGAEGMPDTILRTRCIEPLRAAVEARDVPIQVSIGDQKALFEAGDFTLLAKVVDGTFPDYTRVIPSGWQRTLKIDRDALAEAVSRVAVAVNDKVRAVKLEFEAGGLVRATVTSPEHGVATDEVTGEYDGAPMQIGFNSRYVRDSLSVLDVDLLEVRLGDAATPTIITSAEASDTTLVLMPMRV